MTTVIEIQNKDCDACGICAEKHVCQMDVTKKIKPEMLMVVTDYPSLFDGGADTVMEGKKDKLFWEIAGKVCGIPKDGIYATYAVKCRPSDDDKPDYNELMICNDYLLQEVFAVRPKAILVLGGFAMQAFGYEGSVEWLRGGVNEMTFEYQGEKFKSKVIVTYSPYYVENARHNLKLFAKDIARAHNIAIGATNIINLTKTVEVKDLDTFRLMVDYVHKTKECCFDFETTDLEGLGTFAEGFLATALSVSFQHGSSYVIPLFHPESPFTTDEIMGIFQVMSDEIWNNPDIRKIGQNIKFDMHVAAHYGFPLFCGRMDDTMLMHHILFGWKRHGLKEWAPEYWPEYEGFDEEVKKAGYSNAKLDILIPYAATDTDLTFRGCTLFESLLLQDERLYRIYRNQAIPAIKPLFKAERTGMLINRAALVGNIKRANELLEEQGAKLYAYKEVKRYSAYAKQMLTQKRLAFMHEKMAVAKGKNATNWQEKINAVKAGTTVVYKGLNLGAAKQIGNVMYTEAGFNFPKPYDRKKRAYTMSTDNKFIKLIDDKSGFIKDLLIYRTIEKNLSTYIEGFLPLLDYRDRIHTSFLIHGTVTGRLSSKNPNIQNISKHVKIDHPFVEEVVGMIMSSFKAPKGHAIIAFDFSQAELRIIAELAGEENMIAAYNSGIDLHALTAANLTGRTVEEFYQLDKKEQKKLRSKAKAANFGLIYGQQPKGFMEYAKNNYGVEMTLEEATHISEVFFSAYPRLKDYHALCVARGRRYGYTRTIFGRKRHAFNLHSYDEFIRGNDERDIINHPVQGSCGEMTIFGFTLLDYRLPARAKFANTVHDSIVYYVPYELVPYVVKVGKETCQNLPTELYFNNGLKTLGLAVDAEFSLDNWKAMEEYTPENWETAQQKILV